MYKVASVYMLKVVNVYLNLSVIINYFNLGYEVHGYTVHNTIKFNTQNNNVLLESLFNRFKFVTV